MRYRILGTTQAFRSDGTHLPVGGARLRALLTVLALRPGRGVPVSALVDEVWDGDAPADANGALQALVGRLRRALGAEAVASVEGGYRLCAAPDDIDLHRFERLAGEGTRALTDADPAKAAAVLDDALALWRGPALADLPDRTAEAARCEALRLDVRRARATAALELGEAERILPELTALCDAHPLDEPFQALRLRALRAAGRTAEALAAYESVRRLIADGLGSDPGPELRALHEELLHPTEKRAPVPPSAADTGTPGAGPAPGNLRARLTSFVGREADIEAIRGDLATARLVTLLGPGGAGKTRLSQEAAEAVAATAPDGVWLAELAPLDDPEAVPEAVLTAVGARETVLRGAGAEELRAASDRHDDPLVRLVEHCAKRRMLLILDNCEHVLDAAARLAEELLTRCPELTVLATSREPLGVPGELLRPVEPLPEPMALRLLAERGAAAMPGFRIDADEETAAAAAEICRRLDGLPLAIELAAARLRMLTPRGLADRLDDRFRLLTSGSRTLLARQQTLRAVVDWSWDLLDEDERDVLRRLSVFAGGCDLAAAEAVCGPAALEAIGSLVDKSLVVAAPSPDGEMRYRLLETVAEYAGERLDEAGTRPETARAHLTYYRELVRTTDLLLRGPGQRAGVARLELEWENVRAALQHAVAVRDEQEALCLVLALSWYWQMRDLRSTAGHWSREVMALGPNPFAPPVRPAEPLMERCTDEPPPMRPEVLEEARRGVHLINLACMDLEPESWQTPEARAKLRTITEVYRPGLPQTCRSPGYLWFYALVLAGDVERLHEAGSAAIRTCRELGYEWELGVALQMRANLLANSADTVGDAARDAVEAMEIFTRLGDGWGFVEALSARGEARERQGDYLLAAADFEAAREHAERLGAHAQASVLRTRLGGVLIEAGQGERGERLLREALEERGTTRNEAMPAARLFLAMWCGRTGRTAESRQHLRVLREEFSAVTFVVFDGLVLGLEAWLHTVDGEHEQALDKARRGLERARDPMSVAVVPQMRSTHLITGALALLGLGGEERARDAARLLGAAASRLPARHVPAGLEREAVERAESAARTVLGDAAYEAAYAKGGGLCLEEAAALL
ncbi:AfsR/SARP family transcriptional regulator [Streptomyces cavernae]|uniref:AfsR/SARP family transcriptional regulator n=1 Tax=Streptomyces cavernae TaxID=2259034 RepID=UPI000FEBCBE0|nr:BTAD domain-containing putative transcriptional regulator [Streptomyces cavernae]